MRDIFTSKLRANITVGVSPQTICQFTRTNLSPFVVLVFFLQKQSPFIVVDRLHDDFLAANRWRETLDGAIQVVLAYEIHIQMVAAKIVVVFLDTILSRG